MAEFVRAAGTADVPADAGITAEVKGQAIALFNVGGTFYAIDNTCVHRGGPLGEGELAGTTVTCPWHQWEYDVKTGKCQNNPAACVKTYEVKVEGSDIKVLL
jgi:nitrite reductase (NADH) small subunit